MEEIVLLKIAICDDRKEDRDRMDMYVRKFCEERLQKASHIFISWTL